MSAKILKFTPRPDNKLYVQGHAIRVAPVISITAAPNKEPVAVPPLVPYSDYMKMVATPFTVRENKALNSLDFIWDEKYKTMYSKNEDGELVEKKGKFFFYLYVLPFNMYPCEYKTFKSLKALVAFLESRYSGPVDL